MDKTIEKMMLSDMEEYEDSDECDLDPAKICNNCMKCVLKGDYNAVIIDEIVTEKSGN